MRFLIALALLCSMACSNTDQQENTEYIIDFKDNTTSQQILELEQVAHVSLDKNSLLFPKTKITHAFLNQDAIDVIEDSDLIENFEPVQYYKVIEDQEYHSFIFDVVDCPYSEDDDQSCKPNDPLYREGKQWNMTMIGIEKAWKLSKGENVTVAVLDTGISTGAGKYPRVPDLANTCMKEGYSFVDDNSDAYDWHGHGTHVGGTIAQSTNNGIGVVGIAYKACLLPVKVLDDNGSGRTDDIAEAIIWATDNGAQVINMSLGGGGYSKVMADALKYAQSNNVFVACAAGNSGRPIIEYPAAMDGCSAISSVGKAGELAYYSSHGTNGSGLFIAAPGGDKKRDGEAGGVWQDTIVEGQPTKHGYFPFQGTSMATPHVAGVAALVISELGPQYKLSEVESILKESSTPKNDKAKYGAGILNADKAVEIAKEGRNSNTDTMLYILSALLSVVGVLVASKLKG